MNQTLELKGTFEQRESKTAPGFPNIPSNANLSVERMKRHHDSLIRLQKYWNETNVIQGALIGVYYIKVAAKSNRVRGLFNNESIVGARFYDDETPKHLIIHHVSMEKLNKAIIDLGKCINEVEINYGKSISYNQIQDIIDEKAKINFENIKKSIFLNILVDCYYVSKFDVFLNADSISDQSIISIFDTGVNTAKILENIGIYIDNNRIIDETTVFLRPDEITLLKNKAPYLISMALSDLSELTKTDFEFNNKEKLSIPSPDKEPVIGVIDTLFDQNVYFSEWVDFRNLLPKEIEIGNDDYKHGTAVSSIIVDGPTLNPRLDDNCGRFKVRHFAVAAGKSFSSFSILKNIKQIVEENRDIRVWNLSLGAKIPVNPNFISPEAAILDKIQFENDVIFVIAGTNKDKSVKENMAIGAPADSINSLVVNSVNENNIPASYTRVGPVLSFFTKPDICYYGGDDKNKIKVATNEGFEFVQGTSFAAPWIARKLCYLISVLGLSREVAKALIINSSTAWDKQTISPSFIGHGVVPIKIDNVVNTKDDEIQFILYGVKKKYDTYNYNIPIPINKGKQPFVVKATLCYFPCCSRNQGVDYTNTEVEISIGRLNGEKIQTINNDYQSEDFGYVYEAEARRKFRKWDNVKHVREVLKPKSRPKKLYDKGIWGISLKTKERLDNKKWGEGLKFGVVITLKEIEGVNRIEEFVHNCQLRGWLVNRSDVKNRIELYNIAEEDIKFED